MAKTKELKKRYEAEEGEEPSRQFWKEPSRASGSRFQRVVSRRMEERVATVPKDQGAEEDTVLFLFLEVGFCSHLRVSGRQARPRLLVRGASYHHAGDGGVVRRSVSVAFELPGVPQRSIRSHQCGVQEGVGVVRAANLRRTTARATLLWNAVVIDDAETSCIWLGLARRRRPFSSPFSISHSLLIESVVSCGENNWEAIRLSVATPDHRLAHGIYSTRYDVGGCVWSRREPAR